MLDATQRTTATSDQLSEFIRRLEDRQEPAAFPVFRQDRNSDGGQRETGSSLGYRSLVIQYQRCVLSSLDSSPYGVLQGRLGAVELDGVWAVTEQKTYLAASQGEMTQKSQVVRHEAGSPDSARFAQTPSCSRGCAAGPDDPWRRLGAIVSLSLGASSRRRQSCGDSPTVLPSRATAGAATWPKPNTRVTKGKVNGTRYWNWSYALNL